MKERGKRRGDERRDPKVSRILALCCWQPCVCVDVQSKLDEVLVIQKQQAEEMQQLLRSLFVAMDKKDKITTPSRKLFRIFTKKNIF